MFIYCQNKLLTEKQANRKLLTKKPPSEDDFETIKLISNGAYGWVHYMGEFIIELVSDECTFGCYVQVLKLDLEAVQCFGSNTK